MSPDCCVATERQEAGARACLPAAPTFRAAERVPMHLCLVRDYVSFFRPLQPRLWVELTIEMRSKLAKKCRGPQAKIPSGCLTPYRVDWVIMIPIFFVVGKMTRKLQGRTKEYGVLEGRRHFRRPSLHIIFLFTCEWACRGEGVNIQWNACPLK